MKKIISAQKMYPKRTLVLKYEDAVNDRAEFLSKVLSFLKANPQAETISRLVQLGSLENMRANSTDPNFYAKGRVHKGAGELPPEIIQKCFEAASKELNLLGYRRNG